jgi:hypothetical protein
MSTADWGKERILGRNRMKLKYLVILLLTTLLAGACAGEPAPAEGVNDQHPDQRLISAAMDMVISFNKADVGEETSFGEIPEAFWAAEIEALNPLAVYWHNNNLAVVLSNAGSEAHGLYIYLPISSYRPVNNTIQLTFGQETYRFNVIK